MTDPISNTPRVALVTGASRGIGAAIATELARQGYRVVGTATSEASASAIGESLRAASASGLGRGLVYQANAEGAAEALMAEVLATEGHIDVLVNNAGVTRDNLAMRMKDEEWSTVIDTNLSAVFKLSRAALKPMMKARYGRIISITSVVGLSGNPGQANYAAAKAGLGGMTRALAREIGSRGITVNCVAPGFIETDMTRALPEAQIEALTQQIPAQRLGTPEDIAHAVGFLASDRAGYITGVTLSVNGGMFMS